MNDRSENQKAPNVTIRMASGSDAKILARLRYALRSSLNLHESEEAFVERCRLWMEERLQDHSLWKCWIAERDQTAVGNLWAQLIEKIPNPTSEPEYHIYFTNFYVRKDCRGKGIGSKLFAAALTWSRSKNVDAAILWPTERSLTIYMRHGFSVAGDVMELKIGDSG